MPLRVPVRLRRLVARIEGKSMNQEAIVLFSMKINDFWGRNVLSPQPPLQIYLADCTACWHCNTNDVSQQ
jgi:hypothetical protein